MPRPESPPRGLAGDLDQAAERRFGRRRDEQLSRIRAAVRRDARGLEPDQARAARAETLVAAHRQVGRRALRCAVAALHRLGGDPVRHAPAANDRRFEQHADVVVEGQGDAQRLGLAAQGVGRLEREPVGERLRVQDDTSRVRGTDAGKLAHGGQVGGDTRLADRRPVGAVERAARRPGLRGLGQFEHRAQFGARQVREPRQKALVVDRQQEAAAVILDGEVHGPVQRVEPADDGGKIDDAVADRHGEGDESLRRAEDAAVLHVRAHDPRQQALGRQHRVLDHRHQVHRVEADAQPVAGLRARTCRTGGAARRR